MPAVRKVAVLLAILVGMSAPATSITAADPPLIVTLASGRTFHGELDESSSDFHLVIRSSQRGISQLRSIDWDRIVSAQFQGSPTRIAQLQELARQARAKAASKPRISTTKIEMRGSALSSDAGHLQQPPAVIPRVATVTFDASIANWDADVETDGLVLEIVPIDTEGFLAPVSGTLQVELFAPQRRVFHHAPLSGGDTLELVERWTRAISPEDFRSTGVRVRLPFGAVHPEIDFEWIASWYGLVHVQLAVPGHGVFEDSQDGVRIRPWSPNRDNLEMNTRRRFLPTERLGRHD
jgi:hypothetical protein